MNNNEYLSRVRNAWISPTGEWITEVFLDRDDSEPKESLLEGGSHHIASILIFLNNHPDYKFNGSILDVEKDHDVDKWMEDQGYIKMRTLAGPTTIIFHLDVNRSQMEALYDWCSENTTLYEELKFVMGNY